MYQNLGTNANVQSIDMDKYKVKLDFYEKECDRLRQGITAAMFLSSDTDLGASNYVRSVNIYPS